MSRGQWVGAMWTRLRPAALPRPPGSGCGAVGACVALACSLAAGRAAAEAEGPGRWSLVARDWEEARLLLGRLAATDEVKRERSKRMVVLRWRVFDGPITPFAQLGLGQWRFDPDTPAMPRKPVVAGQLGFGIEYVVASWVSIAFEADCTLLDPARLEAFNPQPREEPDAQSRLRGDRWVHPPALWGGFLAAYA